MARVPAAWLPRARFAAIVVICSVAVLTIGPQAPAGGGAAGGRVAQGPGVGENLHECMLTYRGGQCPPPPFHALPACCRRRQAGAPIRWPVFAGPGVCVIIPSPAFNFKSSPQVLADCCTCEAPQLLLHCKVGPNPQCNSPTSYYSQMRDLTPLKAASGGRNARRVQVAHSRSYLELTGSLACFCEKNTMPGECRWHTHAVSWSSLARRFSRVHCAHCGNYIAHATPSSHKHPPTHTHTPRV